MYKILNAYKAVIFDMDGTLVNSIPFHQEAWLQFLRKYNIDLKPEEFSAQNHGTINEMIFHFFGKSISSETANKLGEEKEEIYRGLYKKHIQEIEGLSNLISNLSKKGIKIALATNSDKPNIEFVLNKIGIKSYFDCITGGHEVSKGKPDPEIYEVTLNKLGLNGNGAIVFEDSPGGVIAASEAGLKVIGVTTSENRETLINQGCADTIEDYKQIRLT